MSQANKRLLLPFGITFGDLEAMVVAMLKKGSQPAFAGRIAEASGLEEHVIGGSVEFLKALGLVTMGSTESRIFLSRTGVRYAQAIVSGDKAEQKKVLSERAGIVFRPVIRFCELAENLDFDRLFLQIKFLANVADEWGQHMDTAAHDRMGICTAIEIMVVAGILDRRYLLVEEEAA